ncbi:transglutaminase-like domain-containing protein [Marinobacter sp. SS21]|uniref:transglutaminase-like domain-containing protein n=1 Tax=Marinobacter sp. SS21 TaxID=2979460 RepID=UPI00232DA51F|nr:transglutaminase-like domain-containing protein [Marinobacter sp. SS21]MDC0663473.1 transglutaminase-like domain-containing protein [Marinobacter sp. SS21]
MTSLTQAYLQATPMLDFHHESLQQLLDQQRWRLLPQADAAASIYGYVRDQIAFGYNKDDTLSASQVLKDGYGQCNTKGTLLMALLRAVGIPTRFHGFTIFNDLQKGAIPGYLFPFAPERIIHSWVEVYLDGKWLEIEGFIIDRPYLEQVQARFAGQCEGFSGYGIATPCLSKPDNDWTGDNTYIQREGIADDLGIYEQPDDFYRQHGSNLKGPRRFLFRHVLRHLMNLNVDRIRRRGL